MLNLFQNWKHVSSDGNTWQSNNKSKLDYVLKVKIEEKSRRKYAHIYLRAGMSKLYRNNDDDLKVLHVPNPMLYLKK